MLKGLDVVMFAVCNAFNLKSQIRPKYIVRVENVNQSLDSMTLFKRKVNLIPPSNSTAIDSTAIDWIGDTFEDFRADEMGALDETLSERLLYDNWIKPYREIYWLNVCKNIEASRAYAIVCLLVSHVTDCKGFWRGGSRNVIPYGCAFGSYS
jgi:hypothetical protein